MHSARNFAVLAVLTACGSSAAPPTTTKPAPSSALRDETRHTTRMVDVATGVALEVIDYGGSGEPIVFLAGLGNTGHVFDELAPALTDRHRVIAITRRGFGVSGTSAEGHDVAMRVADDLAVLDALKLPRVILAGHSIAGDELSEMALTHPERVSALIYLDATHDHLKIGELLASAPMVDRKLPPDAKSSIAKLAAELARREGVALPIGEHLAQRELGPGGEVRGFKGDPKVGGAIIAGTKSFDLAMITTRSLVFLATEQTIDAVFKDLDDKQRAAAEAWWPKYEAFTAAAVADARTKFKAARVIELPKAHHYLFISDRARVLDEIRSFLAK